MNRNRLCRIEQLENRRYLSVTASVAAGVLIVDGQAEGAVEIKAVDAGKFQVMDNSIEVATVEGVKDIRVKLDADGAAAEDKLTLDLAGQTVRKLTVDLGDGKNEFVLQDGTVSGGLTYRGGKGDDSLQIAADAVVQGNVMAQLRQGNNNLEVEGQLGRDLTVLAGNGDDVVKIGENARIERAVNATLGDGANQVTVAGEIGRGLSVRGGADDDIVAILATAQVERSLSLCLGDGDNQLTVSGTIGGSLSYRGGEGDDSVTLTGEAIVVQSACINLGDGDNTVSHNGDIGGDLRVRSANENDTVTIADDAIVGGRTVLHLGEQADDGHRAHKPGGPGRGGKGDGFGGGYHDDWGGFARQFAGGKAFRRS